MALGAHAAAVACTPNVLEAGVQGVDKGAKYDGAAGVLPFNGQQPPPHHRSDEEQAMHTHMQHQSDDMYEDYDDPGCRCELRLRPMLVLALFLTIVVSVVLREV